MDLIPVFQRLEHVFHGDGIANENLQNKPQHEQHRNVVKSLWLSVESSDGSDNSPLVFNDRPRFDDLMREHQQRTQRHLGDEGRVCYPRLVFFVGDTGAGKSSLIQALIGHAWDFKMAERNLRGLLVPVVGSANSLPTSSDIHLFYDSLEAAASSTNPLLFADCEEFGASNHSLAADCRNKIIQDMEKEAPEDVRKDEMKLTQWPDFHADHSKAVEELFPSLVYNISDIVVYVITATNLKSIGKVLEKLIAWSRKAETSSTNRTSLPSLIILINQCDPARTTDWSSDDTTAQLLGENEYLMNGNKTIKSRKDELGKVGLPNKSIKDILTTSYADVKLLRVPSTKDVDRLTSQL
ncbi:hypothetical protein B0J13DRAFT_533151 [Dactylonectria estremocensis]|uniref:Uncharacterized protein n=1 Tax=Dactylonectria estremocensis TaxID=1079267 RepID=A0A9P9IEP3_9HYPO|nr:hypothetical protein B0J13DRAFT_533151 [Dactylonectria estremocensis]